MRAALLLTTPLLAALLAACSEPVAVEPSRQPAEPRAASARANPNTVWQFYSQVDDATAAGITGDGLGVSGTAPAAAGSTGDYEGGKCGVRAQLQLVSGSGDATMDADMDASSKSKCPRRTVVYSSASGLVQADPAPFTNARDVYALSASGATNGGSGVMQWTINQPGCERLRFEGVLIVRVGPSAPAKGQWEVRTTNHTAICLQAVGSSYEETTETYVLPYRILITEI